MLDAKGLALFLVGIFIMFTGLAILAPRSPDDEEEEAEVTDKIADDFTDQPADAAPAQLELPATIRDAKASNTKASNTGTAQRVHTGTSHKPKDEHASACKENDFAIEADDFFADVLGPLQTGKVCSSIVVLEVSPPMAR